MPNCGSTTTRDAPSRSILLFDSSVVAATIPARRIVARSTGSQPASEGDTILLDVENGGLKAMIKPGVEVVDE
jgi:hypothetical protein